MTSDKNYKPSEISRFALRIMLLTLGSGLHHLPKGTIEDAYLSEAKDGLRHAHDFLVSGGQVRVVQLLVANFLEPFRRAGIDPLEIFKHATIARLGVPSNQHMIPVDCDGVIVEFPSPARAFIQTEHILHSAAEDRRQLYWSAISEIERLAFNAHRICGKPQKLFFPARDFAHNGEIFLNNATLSEGELRWNNPYPPMEGDSTISSEGEFIRRHSETLNLLGKHGIYPGRSLPSDIPPSDGSSPTRSRRPKTPTNRKS
ncbi:hypothetical protein [uncultured Roseibium sp.]|uniref:hypothetical protein n=1 Tax=uncultured Roseibium sp. TaxID=1936171 RepID=UPI003216DE56